MVLAMFGIGLSSCADAIDTGSAVADELSERGVAAYAEGRWRCETEEDDGGNRRRITTLVRIGADGRFSYDVDGIGPSVGTWAIDGLELRVLIPWADEGRRGYYPWVYRADADPPTRLSGEQLDSGDGQRLELDVGPDRVTIVQHDEPGPKGANYDWGITCTRESSDPGEIPPTVPLSTPD